MAPVPGTKWLRCSTSAAMRSSDKRLCYRPLLAEADVIIAPMTSRVSRIAGRAGFLKCSTPASLLGGALVAPRGEIRAQHELALKTASLETAVRLGNLIQ